MQEMAEIVAGNTQVRDRRPKPICFTFRIIAEDNSAS
jgi:hypothetical protein